MKNKLAASCLTLLMLASLVATVNAQTQTAPTSFWYWLAVYGYKNQLAKGYTWDWSQVGYPPLNHEDLIIMCLRMINYPVTQFLLNMGDPNPYPPT